MSHNLPYMFERADFKVRDPGAGEALPSTLGLAVIGLATTAAEARSLAAPPKAGQILALSMITDGGDLTLTTATAYDEAGSTTVTFTAVGQMIAFISVEVSSGVYAWRVLSYDGVTGPTTDLANAQATNLDLGASGTAGTLDIFPSTAAKGKLSVSVTDQTGDTTAALIIGAMAAARTITLADPLADADILTGKMSAVARTATADGLTTGTIADAGMLQFITVTSSDANHIVVLPTPTPGRIVILANGGTGYELRSSTPASIAINGGSGSNAESAIAASTLVIAVCKTATAWAAIGLAGTTLAAVEAAA